MGFVSTGRRQLVWAADLPDHWEEQMVRRLC